MRGKPGLVVLGLRFWCWKLLELLACSGWLMKAKPPPSPSLPISVPVTLRRPSTNPPSLSELQLSVCLFRSLKVKDECRSGARCSGGFHLQDPLPSVLGGFTTGLWGLDSGWASTRTILPVLSKPPERTRENQVSSAAPITRK